MFKFKNISSKEMHIYVTETTEILSRASQRVLIEEIEGYNGTFETPLGYNNVPVTFSITIMDKNKLDTILSWLNGKGEFEYLGRVTNVSIYEEVSVSRLINKHRLEVNLVRAPFWYKADDAYIEVENSFINEGNVEVAPLIKLKKGTQNIVELSISGVRFKYDFKDDLFVDIDCKSKNANMNGLRRNRNLEIGYEFPISKVGTNDIIVHTGDPVIEIMRKDAWL